MDKFKINTYVGVLDILLEGNLELKHEREYLRIEGRKLEMFSSGVVSAIENGKDIFLQAQSYKTIMLVLIKKYLKDYDYKNVNSSEIELVYKLKSFLERS